MAVISSSSCSRVNYSSSGLAASPHPVTTPPPFPATAQAVCQWGMRSNGAVQLMPSKKVLKSDADHFFTPLRQWLGKWLPRVLHTVEDLPLLALWLELDALWASNLTVML